MSIGESALSLASPAVSLSRTTVAPPGSLGTEWFNDEWRAVLDRLIDPGRAAGGSDEVRKDEDGYMLPTASAVRAAVDLALLLKVHDQEPPSSVIQNAVGGIVFEWKCGSQVERFICNRRGEMEFVVFQGSKLVFRKPASIMRD